MSQQFTNPDQSVPVGKSEESYTDRPPTGGSPTAEQTRLYDMDSRSRLQNRSIEFNEAVGIKPKSRTREGAAHASDNS